jgi:phenylacetate-CoA ligase
MTILDQVTDQFIGNVTFPLINMSMNRRGILRSYRRMKQSEKLSQEEQTARQLERLRSLLAYAIEYSPYYKAKYLAAGLAPQDIQTPDDVKLIPVLERAELVEHREELVDRRLAGSIEAANQSQLGPGIPPSLALLRKHKLVRNTSAGSTGVPTVFYENGTTPALNWAHELRVKDWFGIPPGAREARMARISADYYNANSRTNRMRKNFWHQLILPGVNLSNEEYNLCIEKLEEFQPRVLWGYTSAPTGLAQHIERNNIKTSFRPELIVTWAAPLYDHERATLERVFQCSITNIYGSRELGHVALMCPEGHLHINQEHYFVENESESDGEPGELLITTLFKRPMPFIRYRIGDIGSINRTDKCACGRSLQIMDSLLGRTGEIVFAPSGRMLSPNFWCRAFMAEELIGQVKRFQVVYGPENNIRVRIEPFGTLSPAAESALINYAEHHLKDDYHFVVEYVSEIKSQPSGKYQMIVHE